MKYLSFSISYDVLVLQLLSYYIRCDSFLSFDETQGGLALRKVQCVSVKLRNISIKLGYVCRKRGFRFRFLGEMRLFSGIATMYEENTSVRLLSIPWVKE